MRALKAIWAALLAWHESLPPATTFAEGQQALMVKLLGRAGLGCTALVVALCLWLIFGKHDPANTRLILYILGGVIGLYGLTNLAIVLSFAVGGPVGRIDLEATRHGFKAGASKDSE